LKLSTLILKASTNFYFLFFR